MNIAHLYRLLYLIYERMNTLAITDEKLATAISDLNSAISAESDVLTSAIADLKNPAVDNSDAIAAIEQAATNIKSGSDSLSAALPATPVVPVTVQPTSVVSPVVPVVPTA